MDPYTERLKRLAGDDDPVAVLAATPDRIRELIAGVPRDVLQRPPQPGKWSIAQILAHLADGEIVFAHRLRMVLAASPAPLTAFDQNQWAELFDYPSADAAASLDLFAAVRAANVRLVRRVSPSLLQRSGTHEEWGSETAESLLRIEAGHDRNHLSQIEGIVGGH